MKILRILWKPDYNTSLINKHDISEAGSCYRMRQKWVTWPITCMMIIIMAALFCPVVGACSTTFNNFAIIHGDTIIQILSWIITPGVVICAMVWFGSKRYAVNNRIIMLQEFLESARHARISMGKLPIASMGDHPGLWNKLSLKERREIVTEIFKSVYDPNQSTINDFLDLLRKERMIYQELPEWVALRLILKPQIYYLYKERKERFEGYISNI